MYSVEEIMKVEYESFKLLVVIFITRQGIPSENTVKGKQCQRVQSERYLKICLAQLDLTIPESRSLHTVHKDSLHLSALIQCTLENRRAMRALSCEDVVQKWGTYKRDIDVILKQNLVKATRDQFFTISDLSFPWLLAPRQTHKSILFDTMCALHSSTQIYFLLGLESSWTVLCYTSVLLS